MRGVLQVKNNITVRKINNNFAQNYRKANSVRKMKRLILVLFCFAAVALTGCEKSYYTTYSFSIPEESWVGSVENDYALMASFLIAERFIGGFDIEGSDRDANNAKAVKAFEESVERLRQYDLKEVMKGATSPGYLNFTYVLTVGSEGTLHRYETFSVTY